MRLTMIDFAHTFVSCARHQSQEQQVDANYVAGYRSLLAFLEKGTSTRFSCLASPIRILETRDEDSSGMLTSLPIELVRMILRRLSVAELFRVRRVCRSLRQEAEAAIARIETLVVNVVCSDAAAAAVAVTPFSCRLSNETLVLLPNSKCHRLLPSVKNLLVWPTFLSGGGDAKERRQLQQTTQHLLRKWSASLVLVMVITDQSHALCLKLRLRMPRLTCFLTTRMGCTTFKSVTTARNQVDITCVHSSPRLQRLSSFRDRVSTREKTQLLRVLYRHQTEWEQRLRR